MNKDQMAKTAQLDQFDEELYKVHLLNTRVMGRSNRVMKLGYRLR